MTKIFEKYAALRAKYPDQVKEIEAEEKPAMLAVALVLVERGNENGR